MRLGVVAYVVPFVFVFHPALIGHGTLAEILLTMFTASVGVVLLGIGCADTCIGRYRGRNARGCGRRPRS